ncbi:hypothetical protein GGR53DRAFT_379197 [Hypoxylon sp. FL1150]|nr:hypothetical protein GGR53DRAFT_379197 [Hypoxylon sp. FL1150]
MSADTYRGLLSLRGVRVGSARSISHNIKHLNTYTTTALVCRARLYSTSRRTPPKQDVDMAAKPAELTGLIAKSGIELLTFGRFFLPLYFVVYIHNTPPCGRGSRCRRRARLATQWSRRRLRRIRRGRGWRRSKGSLCRRVRKGMGINVRRLRV